MTVKMWISKYALTAGVQDKEGELSGEFFYPQGEGFNAYRVGRDAHPTIEEAAKTAEQARLKKIASLKKQIHKLEKLNFTV